MSLVELVYAIGAIVGETLLYVLPRSLAQSAIGHHERLAPWMTDVQKMPWAIDFVWSAAAMMMVPIALTLGWTTVAAMQMLRRDGRCDAR